LAVLKEFVAQQSFDDIRFDLALRRFLSTFRLPGEAQKIDRMMERFAERFIACNPATQLSSDSAYILAFSIIMLNTDLHNPAVKNKIKKTSFIRNNLDVLTKTLPDDPLTLTYRQMLSAIYDAIKEEQIQLHDANGDPMHENPFFYTFFNPEREGWLTKRGGRIKTWKRRYCILTGSCLYYFKFDACTQYVFMISKLKTK
jgi:Sec7-like guanine-nucleotide exchange factor